MLFTFRPIDAVALHTVSAWRYEPPYEIYNITPEDVERDRAIFFDPANHYHQLSDVSGALVAICCFGLDGQVPGGDYSQPALDIGMAVRPDLTGKGNGHLFASAVTAYARQTFAPERLRVTIAEFNKRAQRTWDKAGYRFVGRFERLGDQLPFVMMVFE